MACPCSQVSGGNQRVIPCWTTISEMVRCRPSYAEENGVARSWLRRLGTGGAAVLVFANIAPAAASPEGPRPGMRVEHENMRCTASLAALGEDGGYYFLT